MSPKLPRITARELLRALRRDGWFEDHRRGSHIYLRHPSKPKQVTVPYHAGKTLKPATLAGILDDAELTPDGLERLL